MIRNIIFILAIFVHLWHPIFGGIFSWMFTKSVTVKVDPKSFKDVSADPSEYLNAKIPFEISTADEQFLKETKALSSVQLSNLDVCLNKIVLSIEVSCADLTEEELAKVAVNLFNCQSAVEGRKTYPCTKQMSLAECTKDMDANTWNAYHIVSNRARSMCYVTRQMQFKAKTELTVNKLMESAEQQIYSMKGLQASHSELHKTTSDTLSNLSSGHKDLHLQQMRLASANQAIHSYVAANLRDLTREKKLIASGQKELANIVTTIKKKLEEAQMQLSAQEDDQRQTHSVILQDLAQIQDNAMQVWNRLDESTQKILLVHEQTISQYSQLASDLNEMNATVQHLMQLMHATRLQLTDKLSWISDIVGDTDETMQNVYVVSLHCCYFIIGMIAASFLQVPYLTRLSLFVFVPLNALCHHKYNFSITLTSLTALIAATILIKLLMTAIMKQSKNFSNQPLRNEQKYYLKTEGEINTSENLIPHSANLRKSQEEKEEINCIDDEVSPIVPLLKNYDSSISFPSTPLSRSQVPKSNLKNQNSVLSFNHSQLYDDTKQLPFDSVSRRLVQHLEGTPKSTPRRLFYGTRSRSSTPHKEMEPNSSVLNCSLGASILERSIGLNGTLGGTERQVCSALCKSGERCRITATGGSSLCHRHTLGLSKDSSRENTPFSIRNT